MTLVTGAFTEFDRIKRASSRLYKHVFFDTFNNLSSSVTSLSLKHYSLQGNLESAMNSGVRIGNTLFRDGVVRTYNC